MTILQTKDLKKYYGSGDTQVKALDGVNLEIEEGGYGHCRELRIWKVYSSPYAGRDGPTHLGFCHGGRKEYLNSER